MLKFSFETVDSFYFIPPMFIFLNNSYWFLFYKKISFTKMFLSLPPLAFLSLPPPDLLSFLERQPHVAQTGLELTVTCNSQSSHLFTF